MPCSSCEKRRQALLAAAKARDVLRIAKEVRAGLAVAADKLRGADPKPDKSGKAS